MTKLHYTRSRGRAETTRWMLAVNQIPFENIVINMPEELDALRATDKLPFDQIPLLEIDGHNLSQSSAMIRYLARRGDFYGDTETDALWCDLMAGAVADFSETGLKAMFQATNEIAISEQQAAFAKFAPCFEARLKQNSTGFCAGTRLSFADVILAEALSLYLEWIPDILEPTPLLKALNETVLSQPGIKAYLTSDLRYPKPDNTCVVDIARVLQRSLPPHFPDPNQFVVTS
jgi:glutathione S-transferase